MGERREGGPSGMEVLEGGGLGGEGGGFGCGYRRYGGIGEGFRCDGVDWAAGMIIYVGGRGRIWSRGWVLACSWILGRRWVDRFAGLATMQDMGIDDEQDKACGRDGSQKRPKEETTATAAAYAGMDAAPKVGSHGGGMVLKPVAEKLVELLIFRMHTFWVIFFCFQFAFAGPAGLLPVGFDWSRD